MKYEKATAEVIVFEHEYYMVISSGGRCYAYGKIEDETCYNFSKGTYNYSEDHYPCSCGDVTGSVNPCNVISCVAVSEPWDTIVT